MGDCQEFGKSKAVSKSLKPGYFAISCPLKGLFLKRTKWYVSKINWKSLPLPFNCLLITVWPTLKHSLGPSLDFIFFKPLFY